MSEVSETIQKALCGCDVQFDSIVKSQLDKYLK